MSLHLLDGPETPQEHIRNALQSLDALEQEFLGLQLILPDDVAYKLYFPLARARARLWRAITQLEEAP